MIRAIEDGLLQPSKGPIGELEAEKALLAERLAVAPDPTRIRLHPNLAALYQEKVGIARGLGRPGDQR